jgi:homoserine acetyltransferase
MLQSTAGRGEYFEIDSDHGHDSFLIDLDQVGAVVSEFLDDVQKEQDDQ